MTATCPQCGDELDIPAAFAGRPVRCGSCQSVFTPPAPAPAPPPFADRPAPDDRPSRRPRAADDALPPRRGTAAVWGLGLLTVILTVPCTAGCVWAAIVSVYPGFQPVTDDTGRYQAAFPGDPAPVNRKDADGRLVRGFDLSRDFPPEKYFVYYLDPPPAAGRDAQTVLADAAGELDDLVPAGTRERRREESTHDGFPALDQILDNAPPQPGSSVVRLVLAKSPAGTPRLYVVGVSGDQVTPTDTRARRFFTAFTIAGGKPAGGN